MLVLKVYLADIRRGYSCNLELVDKRFEMLRNALQFLKRVRDDASGNVLALVGMSIVPMVGTMGLAIDAAQWVSWRRDLHSAADAGAIAGAQALINEEDVDAVVRRILGLNNQHQYTIEAIETPPTEGEFTGDASMVRIVVSTSQPLPFSSMFLSGAPTIRAEAVAQASNEVPNCMIALDSSDTGLVIEGSATVNMTCGMASNSNFDATASGSDTIKAGALSAVGHVNATGGVSADTAVHSFAAAATDPFADQISDQDRTCGQTLKVNGTVNWNRETDGDCLKGITIQAKSTLILSPGVYIIGSDGVRVAGQATIIGLGVTLIFTNTDSPFDAGSVGIFESMGTSNVQLTAPTTGDYAGLIMVQDSRAIPNNSNDLTVTGDNASVFEGAIYAPSNHVRFSGNSSMDSDCLQIVSRYITFTGNTHVSNNCEGGRGVVSFNGDSYVRLRK